MTWRARAYLLVLTLRHFGVGLLCLAVPDKFTSSSYSVIRDLLPLQLWGVLLAALGVHAALAVVFDSERWARWVLVFSAAFTAAWTVGFAAAAIHARLDAPPLPITWAAFTFKDLIVSRMPFRTPLEDVARARGLLG